VRLPLSRNLLLGCGARGSLHQASRLVPTPLSHRRRIMRYRVSRVRQLSLALSASVTWASWGCGSPAPLARVPAKLDLMPAVRGYPHSFGRVRTRLPYQPRRAMLAWRRGLAPRPVEAHEGSSSSVGCFPGTNLPRRYAEEGASISITRMQPTRRKPRAAHAWSLGPILEPW
jgi:hypothetical protein